MFDGGIGEGIISNLFTRWTEFDISALTSWLTIFGGNLWTGVKFVVSPFSCSVSSNFLFLMWNTRFMHRTLSLRFFLRDLWLYQLCHLRLHRSNGDLFRLVVCDLYGGNQIVESPQVLFLLPYEVSWSDASRMEVQPSWQVCSRLVTKGYWFTCLEFPIEVVISVTRNRRISLGCVKSTLWLFFNNL